MGINFGPWLLLKIDTYNDKTKWHHSFIRKFDGHIQLGFSTKYKLFFESETNFHELPDKFEHTFRYWFNGMENTSKKLGLWNFGNKPFDIKHGINWELHKAEANNGKLG